MSSVIGASCGGFSAKKLPPDDLALSRDTSSVRWRRGGHVASAAASLATEAAQATAEAARAALAAATRAELSALATAEAAKSVALHSVADLADANADADLADASELAAKEQYRAAVRLAEERVGRT